MKPSVSISAVLLVALFGLAGAAVAELRSALRGAEDIPVTNAAPKLEKYINDKENIERNFEQQPPLVPHTTDKYTINLRENKCVECHMKQPGKDESKAVEMSDSHFVDRTGKKLDQPASNRHFCKLCHVPQIDAEPLVGSNFRSASTR